MILACMRILPWVLAAFLGGVLLGLWNGDHAIVRQYEERLTEHRMREDVLDGALTSLARDKYQKRDALVGAIRRLYPAPPKP